MLFLVLIVLYHEESCAVVTLLQQFGYCSIVFLEAPFHELTLVKQRP